MGCESSQGEKPLGIRINIVDSNFSKSDNSRVRQKMDQLAIKYEVYLSMPCFIQDMLKVYTNELIVTEDLLLNLLKELEKAHFHPNIYVLKSSNANSKTQMSSKFLIKYFASYDEIICELTDKTQKKRISNLNPALQKSKKHIVLKIFRKKSSNSSEEMIFEQTLKSKNISYEIYQTFSELQDSLQKKTSNFIITDYVYHREVISLVENTSTKVICFCDFEKEETYDPKTYFITNNFLEIVSQIVSEEKMSKMNFVKCSKVYIYSSQVNTLSEYADIIQHFDFQVKIYSDLKAIIKESKYFFALTLVINPEQRKEVETILQNNDYLFKTKIVEIKKGTQNSVRGLRKTIKQLKKGYRASKGLTKTIDIIDKHFDNVKFNTIKKQLQKCDIKFYGYQNLSEYIKKKKFMSPFIICNFDQHSLVVRYTKQIKSQSKIILFCNKNYITTQLKQKKNFSFVSSHFGKIINFIKKNNVYNPFILDDNEIQIRNRKEKLNKNNKRISALNWCGGAELLQRDDKAFGEMEKNFQFLNVNEATPKAEIQTIQKQFASLFSLEYSPLECPLKHKENFITSLRKLKTLLKINYPEGQFQKLVSEVENFNTFETMTKIMSFFSSQNEMGFKINKNLKNIESLSKEEILCLKEYMLYVNMNFLTVYRDTFMGRVKLHHYLKSQLIQKCQLGSSILNKNYCIFYESDDTHTLATNEQKITPYKIQLQLQIDPTTQTNPPFNSYFRYNQKFIFCPYTQFEIKSIIKNNGETVIQVQHKKNIDYLKYYFAENLHKQQPNFLTFCQDELEKSKTTIQPSFLFDSTTKESFSLNLLHTKALSCYQTEKLEDAIKCQKELIIREESLENFDSAKLQWLNYELACYHLKNQNHTECKRMLQELMETEPNDFMRERIRNLSRNFRKSTQDKIIPPVDELIKEPDNNSKKGTLNPKNIKTIQLDNANDDNDSEVSSQRNIFDFKQYNHENHEIQCLDFQMLQNFENDQKENIA